MAPRKTTAPLDPHADAPCAAPRIETFKAHTPSGDTVTVTRCQECGVQVVK